MQNIQNESSFTSEESNSQTSLMVQSYLQQLRSITVIRHLFPVIVASQRHRGIKLALLEGDQYFSSRIDNACQDIDNRLSALLLLNTEMNFPVSKTDIMALSHEWETIKSWSGGPSLENYNLHSHFIEQQMKLIWKVAEETSCFASCTVVDVEQQQHETSVNDKLLIRFILHETPELIELVAKIRGLATYIQALGTCDDENYSRLDYMLTVLNQKKEKFRVLSKQLQRYVLRDVPALIELQMQDARLIQLANLVNKMVLTCSDIRSEDHSIFSLATTVIDSQTEIVKQGLDYIQSKVHQLFDSSIRCS